MVDFFSILTAASSLLFGSSSLAALLIRLVRERLEKREAMAAVEKTRLENALESDDLGVLGGYLDDRLGEVSVYQFSTDPKLRRRVEEFLETIQSYVGVTEEVEKQAEAQPEHEFGGWAVDDLPERYKKLAHEVFEGEPWNALARLRRNTEKTLRSAVREAGFDESRMMSAMLMIRRLSEAGIISPSDARDLSFAMAVANKAIHGQDVLESEALEAITMTWRGLRELEGHAVDR